MLITPELLKTRQNLSIEEKINFTKDRIVEFYEANNGSIYCSVSGRDSVALLHITRQLFPNIKGVFAHTGLEFPEIVSHWRNEKNIDFIYPKMKFDIVVKRYGLPVISKDVSMGISRYRNTKSPLQKSLRLHGGTNPTSGKKQQRSIPIKYHYMVDAPFKISEECCNRIKKEPLNTYYKKTGLAPMTGEMASDSRNRRLSYLQTGCNVYDRKIPKSKPLSIWNHEDILKYTHSFQLKIPSIYDHGYDSTGCMFCMFGLQQEIKNHPGELNRFQKMKLTHPIQWKYCMEKLGIRKALDYMHIPSE